MPATSPRSPLHLGLAAVLGLTSAFASEATASSSTFAPSAQPGQEHLVLDSPGGPFVTPSRRPHMGQHGSSVVADGAGLLIAERNAGVLIRSDMTGVPKAQIKLQGGLGQVVSDGGKLAFVADRSADRVVRVRPGGPDGEGLALDGEVTIREPYGLALTPDGSTLLITSVADHQLVAVDTTSLEVRWRAPLPPEPRGVAVSSDGREATVGFLTSGALAIVDLTRRGSAIRWQTLNPRDQIDVSEDEDELNDGEPTAELREARSRFQVPTSTGRRYGRVAFAVGYVAGDRLIAPHQVATPQLVHLPDEEQSDSYGGVESIPPLVHRLAIIDRPGADGIALAKSAELRLHQPRALAYDAGRDTLYVGAYGDDRVLAVADASLDAPRATWVAEVGAKGQDACGVDGLVVAGDRLVVHCELSRRIITAKLGSQPVSWNIGPETATSLRSENVERGAEIFRRGLDRRLSGDGVLACATCHPEGRADGLTWRLGPSVLQTPMLAGRVHGTAPFKWDGQDRDLAASLRHTVQRLGGLPHRIDKRDFDALQAFIESMPAPRSRSDLDPEAVARGEALFTSESLACDACHTGSTLSDGAQHSLAGPLAAVDTPSLIGLGHSAPYYHDGSATDLYALVTDKGNVHDMVDAADLAALPPPQARDLITYLESL